MTPIDRARNWLTTRWLAPDAGRPSSVHLSQALAAAMGVDLQVEPAARTLADDLPTGRHLVFLLADGLGCAILERLGEDSFLRCSLRRELRAVFPSATASALTSLATGAWPKDHGVTGWWTHLPEHGITATALPFVERFEDRPLGELGIGLDVFPVPALLPRYARRTLAVQPQAIAHSSYSRYFLGDTPALGYTGLEAGVEAVLAHVRESTQPSFTYFYVPDVDHAGHAHGPRSPEVLERARAIDAAARRLRDGLGPQGHLVLSADHGQIEVPPERKHVLTARDPLLDFLAVPPYGEPRAPQFSVRPGSEAAFRRAFEARFGEEWALLSVDEVEALGLLGPGRLGATTRARLGSFLALAAAEDVLLFRPGPDPEGVEGLRGYHGGLLPAEMRIPLVVA